MSMETLHRATGLFLELAGIEDVVPWRVEFDEPGGLRVFVSGAGVGEHLAQVLLDNPTVGESPFKMDIASYSGQFYGVQLSIVGER